MLPVKPVFLLEKAKFFVSSIVNGHIPDIATVSKDCGSFDPRIMLKIFLNGIQLNARKLMETPAGSQAAFELSKALKDCWNNVTVYNQSVISAMEILVRDIAKINKIHGNVLKWAVM